jgi:hypothetical protein
MREKERVAALLEDHKRARVAGTLLMERELMGRPSIEGQRRAELWMSCRTS